MHLYVYSFRKIGLAYILIKFCFHIKQEETAPYDVGKLAITSLSDLPTDDKSVYLWQAGLNPDSTNSIKSVCYHHEAKFGSGLEIRAKTNELLSSDYEA